MSSCGRTFHFYRSCGCRSGHLGDVEVDDNVDGLDVDTPGEQATTDEIAIETVSEKIRLKRTLGK
jgi:hypothetical protein